ncbi:MAG: hypothetical protein U0521_09150 [Anaerolineae bacterium]
MGKSARRRLLAALIGVLLALLSAEALLAWLDPLGFVYFAIRRTWCMRRSSPTRAACLPPRRVSALVRPDHPA